jgi:two-component system cell cycle response regulator CpdR
LPVGVALCGYSCWFRNYRAWLFYPHSDQEQRVYDFRTKLTSNGAETAIKGSGMTVNELKDGKMHRILLAEDDEDMRKFLVKALQNAGYDVVSFANGMEAYERLKEEPFTLLLTDIVMPEMDGIELARRAADLDPDLKIMFITGFAAVALNPDSEAPKDAKVLSKPFHLKDLVGEIERLLAA